MKRIILHWTAGGHTPSNLDLEHYHFIIDGSGRMHYGKWPVRANESPQKGKYAAHTLNCNTGSIGVSVAAMAGAQERPFDAGRAPITPEQVEGLVTLCRRLCAEHHITVTRKTVLSHAEVQPTLGIKQRGKWDIAWLPGMKAPGDPVKVGDHLRGLIMATAPLPVDMPDDDVAAILRGADAPKRPVEPRPAPVPAKPAQGFWAWLFALISNMRGKK